QLRRMCKAVGHPVRRLIRVRMGPLTLGNLPPGQHRSLTPQERELLAEAVGLRREFGSVQEPGASDTDVGGL
ncbi:MAG: hypothetical protein JSW37_01920, partial [Anaerolineales bacterium]